MTSNYTYIRQEKVSSPVKKRRSFRELIYSSLSRKRSNAKAKAAKMKSRALSEGGGDSPAAIGTPRVVAVSSDNEERGIASRSVSLDPTAATAVAAMPIRPRTNTATSTHSAAAVSLSSSPPQYVNESAFGLARPPQPPDRTASLPPQPPDRSVSLPPFQLSDPPCGRGRRRGQGRVLHRVCRRRLRRADGSAPHAETDIVLVYSKRCEASSEWAAYFARGYTMVPGNRRSVRHQTLEEFSSEGGGGNSSIEDAEESTAHAVVQVVLVSPDFLLWVSRHREMLPGRLLIPQKLIALMVGIDPAADLLEEEHRKPLVAFDQWRTIQAKANDEDFALNTFREITSLLNAR